MKRAPVGLDGAATKARLAEAARRELRTREVIYPQQVANGTRSADEAGRAIAAWRAIVGLLDDPRGLAEFEPVLGATPAQAWPELVDQAGKALNHRAGKGDGEQAAALRALRSSLIRSGIRQGANLPCSGATATVGVAGPRKEDSASVGVVGPRKEDSATVGEDGPERSHAA